MANEVNTGEVVDLVKDQWTLVGRTPCKVQIASDGPALVEQFYPDPNVTDIELSILHQHWPTVVRYFGKDYLFKEMVIHPNRDVYGRGLYGPAQVIVTPL